jgi:hypothetical protein
MKTTLLLPLLLIAGAVSSQSIVGTWQLSEEKTCFQSQSQFEESDTEKELASGFGSTSKTTVAKLISFDKKGSGEEGIFSKGKKKGSDKSPFKYKISGQELQFLDKKSGMITSRFVIEELSANVLRFHDAERDCEVKAFVRVK